MLYRRLPVPDVAVEGDPVLVAALLSLADTSDRADLPGTGNFVAPPGRYWNSFVMDATVLVEPAPTALPHLRRCGFRLEDIEVVVVSHFHADHCFGWPFLLQALAEIGGAGRSMWWATRDRGPPGRAEPGGSGGVGDPHGLRQPGPALRRGRRDLAGGRAAALPGRRGRSTSLPALLRLSVRPRRRPGRRLFGRHHAVRRAERAGSGADVLVVECNGRHTPPGVPSSHMDEESVRALQQAHPDVRLILTHLGEQVTRRPFPGSPCRRTSSA